MARAWSECVRKFLHQGGGREGRRGVKGRGKGKEGRREKGGKFLNF
jgi:hypothetical protein